MPAHQFGLGPIGQIALIVDDLPAATAFYRDVLGMKYLFEAPGMTFFDCGGIRLMLGTAPGEEEGTIIYYRVADIEGAVDVLRSRGAAIEREPRPVHKAEDHELWLAFLRDPDGHVLALMSEVSAE